MLGVIENVVMTYLVNWILAGAISWFKVMLAWSWAHPVTAFFVWFCLFGIIFAAYGTFRRMWEDGSFRELGIGQKATLLAILFMPFLLGYLADILILRCVYGWITFGVPPWKQDWKVWSASWTFSRLVALYRNDPGYRGRHARFWNGILHAIDPYGH
jgi:hypothetical protein